MGAAEANSPIALRARGALGYDGAQYAYGDIEKVASLLRVLVNLSGLCFVRSQMIDPSPLAEHARSLRSPQSRHSNIGGQRNGDTFEVFRN